MSTAKKGKKVVQRKEPDLSFWKNLQRFVEHQQSIKKAMLSLETMKELMDSESKGLEDLIKKYGKDLPDDDGMIAYFYLPPRHRETYLKLFKERENSRIGHTVLPVSLFVSMLAQYEFFISILIKQVLRLQPDIISSEKPITYGDLKGFSSIDEALEHLVEREVDAILYESASAHLEWVGKKVGIKVRDDLSEEWQRFVEIHERRNLYVHCDGVVNARYLRNCEREGLDVSSIKIGDALLPLTTEYFDDAKDCLYRVSVKLTFLVWRKLVKGGAAPASYTFNNRVAIELIKSGRYELAEHLLIFAIEKFEGLTDDALRYFVINLALSMRRMGRNAEAMEKINEFDWSATNNEFRLARAILLGKYSEAFDLMRRIGANSEFISERGYLVDPIYEELRAHENFASVYESVFGSQPDFSNLDEQISVPETHKASPSKKTRKRVIKKSTTRNGTKKRSASPKE